MARMDDSIRQILEIVTDIQERQGNMEKRMATKDDIQNLQAQINENTRAIKENTDAIETLSEDMRGVRGYAKEIDMLLARVNVIEKHIGISK